MTTNAQSPAPWRLHLLPVTYAIIALGMGSMTWPAILTHGGDWALMSGAVKCMLGALTLLAVVGIFQPLKMVPLLFWEIAWKAIWLIAVALPAWRSVTMDADTADLAFQIIWVVLLIPVIPWGYVVREFSPASAQSSSYR